MEGQQHERRRVSSPAGTKIAAMCKVTCILVFSLNHAAKSSIPLLPFGSYTCGELLSWYKDPCCQARKTPSHIVVDSARKVR